MTRTLILLCINQHTKFEVPSFTISEDMIGAKYKKTGHVNLNTSIESQALDIFYLHTKFGDCRFSYSGDIIIVGVENENGSRDPFFNFAQSCLWNW